MFLQRREPGPRRAAGTQTPIHEALYAAILASDVAIRHHLYAAIVCSGGSTLFDGFGERLSKEIHALAPPGMRIRVMASPAHRNFAWVGGSILTCLGSFRERWITREEYDEVGAKCVEVFREVQEEHKNRLRLRGTPPRGCD